MSDRTRRCSPTPVLCPYRASMSDSRSIDKWWKDSSGQLFTSPKGSWNNLVIVTGLSEPVIPESLNNE